MKAVYKTSWILCFAIAMGYLESAVVVYLRALYYPEGFSFPLRAMAPNLAATELYREAATLIMIIAVSALAAKCRLHRFAWFLIVFGVWDISYYLFLKVLLNWPASVFTTDILFLLPCIWTGPVIAPVINSITMILLAAVILSNREGEEPLTRLSSRVWLLLITGSLMVLISYMKDFIGFALEYKHSLIASEISNERLLLELSAQFVPRSFDWLLFCAGVGAHFTAIFLILIKKGRR